SAGTGTIDLTGGTFNLSSSNEISDNSKLQVDGGTFGIDGNSETVAQLILNGGSVTGTGILTSTATIDVRSGSASAILQSTNGLSKTTTGNVTLSGANTYSGATTISGGTLTITNSSGLGATGSGNSTSITVGTLELSSVSVGEAVTISGLGVATDDGALKATGTSSISVPLTLSSSAALGGAGTLTTSGITGTGSLVKQGTGTLVLTG